MSQATQKIEPASPPSHVAIGGGGRRYSLIWLVPIVAALISGYLVFQRVREVGPAITIKFRDGSGLRPGVTPVKYRGVSIGLVDAVELSHDRQYVLATAHLHRADGSMANEGARFWIVRPQVGVGNITGLSTVITGPEIKMLPGTGRARSEFVGLESAPPDSDHSGLAITLHGTRLGSLRPGSPIFYRGIEVGAVQSVQLSPDARGVDVQVHLPQRFAPLIGSGTKFWKVGGVEIHGGLFRGLEFKIESLSTMVTGGIELATPAGAGTHAGANGASFVLYDAPRKEWLEWTPKISIGKEQPGDTVADGLP